MNQAKETVAKFISRDGRHQTKTDEEIRPAVTEEHVRPHRHETVTTAVDKEVHQDHHHTTVQPIQAKETLPEKHTHNLIPVEHKTFEHEDGKQLRSTLDQDKGKYRDSSVTHDTTHSASVAPAVGSEHVHHHFHEHIQPVIQKETVQPEVIHTTVPIHEVHHAAAVHHGTTVRPAKTLEEFKAGGGSLTGKAAGTVGEREGCPERNIANVGNNAAVAPAKQNVTHGQNTSTSKTDGYGLSSDANVAANKAFDSSASRSTTREPRTDPNLSTTSTRSSNSSSKTGQSLLEKVVSKVHHK